MNIQDPMLRMARTLAERKFVLPLVGIIAGAVMVGFNRLDGSAWAAMTTTLVMGFYAVTGWATNRETINHEIELQALEKNI